jgi:hypothetical protein
MKLLEAHDCAQCFHHFEIDTYGRGCVHNCAYCYTKSYLSIRRRWNEWPLAWRASPSRASGRASQTAPAAAAGWGHTHGRANQGG